MSDPKIEVYVQLYEELIKSTLGVAEKIAEGSRTRQAQAEKSHPTWLLGHLAFSFDQIVNVWTLGGENVLPAEYGSTFAPAMAGGKPITSDASDYPSWDELVANYTKAGETCVAGIQSLQDSDLDGPVKGSPPDQFKEFFVQCGSTLRGMGVHDAHHRGQMALLGSLDG